MGACLIELHYLPSLEWFLQTAPFEEIIIEKHEYYEKQSYRNRCHIRAAHGLHRLIVPVRVHGKIPIHSVPIDYQQKWINNHWRTIVSAYRHAPFFEHYADELHRILYASPPFLYQLNRELLQACLRWLNLSKKLSETSAYIRQSPPEVRDLRNRIHPKRTIHDSRANIIRYRQVFGTDFMANLSILDLLCCEGPEAGFIISSGT